MPTLFESDARARVVERARNLRPEQAPKGGRVTHRDWGVLSYRHLDHHFRQFDA